MLPAHLLVAFWMMAPAVEFVRHEIDSKYPGGYQVAVADVNGDGRLDVIALSTDGNRVDWYENPTWKRRPVARIDRPIDLAVHDLDGDGRPEIALASGFYFDDSRRGGEISWLKAKANLDEPWEIHPIAKDPVVHRLRWADLDGDGRKELVHAPIFGPGSKANIDPKPSHLWAFRPPKDLQNGKWEVWKIDESLTVLHGIWTGPSARSGAEGVEDLFTASFEGVSRFSCSEEGSPARWERLHFSKGTPPRDDKPGTARGASEVAVGCLVLPIGFVASIEPWHGNRLMVQIAGCAIGKPQLLDDSLHEGHALVVADFDGDKDDEIIAGWRGGGGGLNLYDYVYDRERRPMKAGQFRKTPIERGIAVEGAVAADINGDSRLDLVAIAGRTNNVVWYENRR